MNAEYEHTITSLLKRRRELKPVIEKVRSSSTGAYLPDPATARACRDAAEENMIIEHMILDLCERMFPTDST